MPWTFDYKVGPPGGTLLSILDYATMVRFPSESVAGLRGSDPMAQYMHGEVSAPRKFYPARTFNVEIHLRETNNVGGVTHTDGAAGHIYENYSELVRLFSGGQNSLVRLERTAPDSGTSYLDCWQVGDVRESQSRLTFIWPMRAPSPFWVGAADTANTPPTLTVAGNAPIHDMVVNFTGGTNARLTHTATGDYIQIDDATPGGGVRVNVGTGAVTLISGGADHSNALRVNRPWWMILDPGANAVTLTGGGTVSVDWFTKWR